MFDFILEGDALQIVKAITTYLSTLSRFGHFIERIKKVLMSLWSFSVVHMRREANTAVHALAKAVSAKVTDSIWLEEVTHFLYDIVCRQSVVPTF
jgi:hypothetical protein